MSYRRNKKDASTLGPVADQRYRAFVHGHVAEGGYGCPYDNCAPHRPTLPRGSFADV